MNSIYRIVGLSKQGFHLKLNLKKNKEELNAPLLKILQEVRYDHPCMSMRKMYYYILPEHLGRDAFEHFCKLNNLEAKIYKSFIRTTNSSGVKRFNNSICGIEVTGVNQVFVSDITYYRVNNNFHYITLIMDLYSRKIVGYCASKDLRALNTTIKALNKLKKSVNKENIKDAIIHSDGGGQYYSDEFLKLTKKLNLTNSMAYSVFENSHAERLNGTIKNEYLQFSYIDSFSKLEKELYKAVYKYNNEIPHLKLNYITPNDFYEKSLKGEMNKKMKVSDYQEINFLDYKYKDKTNFTSVKGI